MNKRVKLVNPYSWRNSESLHRQFSSINFVSVIREKETRKENHRIKKSDTTTKNSTIMNTTKKITASTKEMFELLSVNPLYFVIRVCTARVIK